MQLRVVEQRLPPLIVLDLVCSITDSLERLLMPQYSLSYFEKILLDQVVKCYSMDLLVVVVVVGVLERM